MTEIVMVIALIASWVLAILYMRTRKILSDIDIVAYKKRVEEIRVKAEKDLQDIKEKYDDEDEGSF